MATLTMLEQAPTPKSVNRGAEEFNDLTTETANTASEGLDTKSALEIARIINHEDAKVAAAVKKALPEIAIAIDTVARALRDGGRLIYVGAGSSGRISSLDASECPPTYSTSPAQVQYIMAGRATHPATAPPLGPKPPAVTCNTHTPLSEVADTTIIAEVGPEVVSGSTRMKASTAQKMILNMITTGAMTRLGYVYDNLMVNVHMKNAKLVERGIRVLMNVCEVDRDTAIRTIKSAGKSIPIAVVMLKANVDKMEAVRRLTKSDGNVRLAIDDSRLEL